MSEGYAAMYFSSSGKVRYFFSGKFEDTTTKSFGIYMQKMDYSCGLLYIIEEGDDWNMRRMNYYTELASG